MQLNQFSLSDPIARARNVEGIIEVLKEHCVSEVEKFSDPEVKALFDSTARVLEGLSEKFRVFLTKDQVPWERYEDTIFEKSSDPWD
jgi:hypothetical protein